MSATLTHTRTLVHLKIRTLNIYLSAPASTGPRDQFDSILRTPFPAFQPRPHRGFAACTPCAKLKLAKNTFPCNLCTVSFLLLLHLSVIYLVCGVFALFIIFVQELHAELCHKP